MSGWADAVLPRDSEAILAGERLRPRGVVVCAALSLVCHAAIGLSFNVWGLRETGFIATPTDSVSVELFASDVMEQVATPEASASASAAAVAPQQGSAIENAVTERAKAEAEPERTVRNDPAPKPEAEQTPRKTTEDPVLPATAEPSDVSPSPVSPEQKEARKQEAPAEDKPKPKRDEGSRPHTKKAEKAAVDAKSTRSAKQGGAQSRGQTSSSAAGRVSASSGDISGYAARVRARVAANRPPGRGMRGTCVVSFGVSKGGGLTYARVARSSGNASLDQAAVSAVRRAAPFPPPPAGATSGQLRFSTSFHFR